MSLEAPRVGSALGTAAAPGASPQYWGGVRRAALLIDRGIGRTAEAIGALLVAAEGCILFAGVVSRYVFNSPLMWTDELANFLFLWLAMLGAVVALRNDGHMRLSTFVNRVGPEWGNWLGTVAALIVIGRSVVSDRYDKVAMPKVKAIGTPMPTQIATITTKNRIRLP